MALAHPRHIVLLIDFNDGCPAIEIVVGGYGDGGDVSNRGCCSIMEEAAWTRHVACLLGTAAKLCHRESFGVGHGQHHGAG